MESKIQLPNLPFSPAEIDVFLSEPSAATVDSLRNLDGDIVVLGAGGKMGLHLCLLLKRALVQLESNNRVIAVSRFGNLKERSEYDSNGIETIAGDLRDDDFVRSLPDAETVFYLVGAKFGTADKPELLREINVEVSERMAARYQKSRIVAFSTGCVYSYVSPESGGSHEGSPTEGPGEYAQSCLQREQCFLKGSEEYGTKAVLIRLNYSVEFRYGVLVDICSKVLREDEVDVSTGYVNVIWQCDAINQIVQSLALAHSPAVPLNITGVDTLSVRDLAIRFGKILGKTPVITGEENDQAWLSNAGHSHHLFGEPSIGIDTMIEWTAAWLSGGGETYGKPTGFERRDGKF